MFDCWFPREEISEVEKLRYENIVYRGLFINNYFEHVKIHVTVFQNVVLNASNHRGHETFFQKIEEILIDYSDSHTNLMHAHTHFVVVVVVVA